MKNPELDSMLEKLQAGKITRKQAVEIICLFIMKNYPIFGLHKFDEDFRSELILSLLERGEAFLQRYNPESGDFFTFLYCSVTMMITGKRKSLAKKAISESCAIEELANTIQEQQVTYQKLTCPVCVTKAPFTRKQISPEELSNTLHALAECHEDKKLLVLSLKASFYLTETQIERICQIYHINKYSFYEIIQQCKDSIRTKTQRRQILVERRNQAYYQHKRYRRLIANAEQEEDAFVKEQKLSFLSSKEKKYNRMWNDLNYSFSTGHLYLRPTNKTVAGILGICERQVSYYLNCAKQQHLKNNSDQKEASN